MVVKMEDKKNVMGGICGTYGERNDAYGVLVGRLMERNRFEYIGLDGKIVLK
jgi:hypothetical protein